MSDVHFSTDPIDDAGLRRRIALVDRSVQSPVVLHAPHGGTDIPLACLASFTVPTTELAQEHRLLADHETDHIVRLVPGASWIAPRLSRLVVDVERFEGDAEEMNAVGMGVLYTHGSHGQPIRTLDQVQRQLLLTYYRAYGALFADLVDRVLEQHGRAVIIDLHSYPALPLPYELHADERRPELCLGVDDFHTPAALLEAVRAAFEEYDRLENEPFHGAYVPLRHYRRDRRVQSVMLEIRRDTYLDQHGQPDDAAIRDIALRLRALVAECEGS